MGQKMSSGSGKSGKSGLFSNLGFGKANNQEPAHMLRLMAPTNDPYAGRYNPEPKDPYAGRYYAEPKDPNRQRRKRQDPQYYAYS